MTGLEMFVNPGYRHVQAERERQASAVDDDETGDPPFGVDLDRMTVTLPRRAPAAQPAAPEPDPDADADGSGDTADGPAGP